MTVLSSPCTALNQLRIIQHRCERVDPERMPLRRSAAAPMGVPAHPIAHISTQGQHAHTGDPERQGRASLDERRDGSEALLAPINGGEVMG